MSYSNLILGLGVVLMLLGLLLGGMPSVSIPQNLITTFLGSLTLVSLALTIHLQSREVRRRVARLRHLRELPKKAAGGTEEWIPLLYGDYQPYVIEAAEQLGAGGDRAAVPALLDVLETVVEQQRPGWCEVAEALAKALRDTGDSRALPLLYRLDNVHGIGLIPSIREAIAAIEPRSILLRPGSPNHELSRTLLRAPSKNPPDQLQQQLLRIPSCHDESPV